MTQTLAINDTEKLEHLAEQVKAIIANAQSEMKIQMVAAKYAIGEEIRTHDLFKKYGKEQSTLYEGIERITGIRVDTLADCVKFYEAYPKQDALEIAAEVVKEHKTWGAVRKALYGGGDEEPNDVRNIVKGDCRHCSLVEEAFRGEELIWGDWNNIKKEIHGF